MVGEKGNIHIQDKGDFIVMQLDGTFNSEDHNVAIRETFKKLSLENKNRIIVDFATTFYINSTAIRGLMSGRSLIKKIDGNIVFCNLNDYVENILRLTRLHITFSFCKDMSEAEATVMKDTLN